MSGVLLAPIKESTEDYEAIEKEIKNLFKRLVYLPILKELETSHTVLKNSIEDLVAALQTGKITFSHGSFSGKFNAQISKELKALGAKFDRKSSSFKIRQGDLPYPIRHAISASETKFQERLNKIDEKLAKIVPEELASKLKVEKSFDRALWKVDRDFKKSVKGISIAPELTAEQRRRISAEWGKNMQLWIEDFTQKEIVELRQNVQKSALAGDRYGSAVKTIQASYGVTERKAKFLASQETSLFMTKFKQTRYQDAGVDWYKWGCVSGSKNHPVRPWHRALEGKYFRWDSPPVTSEPGTSTRRNNPGQDYNCRCFARPAVGYRPQVKTR